MPDSTHQDLLVGIGSRDDGSVFRLRHDLAIVQTVDFFPPIVDDPYQFGLIAAANALSDIYAMGAVPIIALNIVMFPIDIDNSILLEILKGGHDKAHEAGVIIAGGHTINDQEPKYGLSVTGTVTPGNQITNTGARPGDLLVLTKPIGTGIITTAGKYQLAPTDVLETAITAMGALNAPASSAMVEAGAHACTDVTGFGLLGHLFEMVKGSNVSAEIHFGKIPTFPGIDKLIQLDTVPAGTHRNMSSLGSSIIWDRNITAHEKLILCDPQTSGGLLIAIGKQDAPHLLNLLSGHKVSGSVIGEIIRSNNPTIRVLS